MTTLPWTHPRHPWMRDFLLICLPDEDRWCGWCGELLPATARPDRRYCSPRCKWTAANDRARGK